MHSPTVAEPATSPPISFKDIEKRVNFHLSHYNYFEELPTCSREDFRQECWETALSCLARHDASKPGLRNLIDDRIKGRILDVLRREGKEMGKGRGYQSHIRYLALLERGGVEELTPEEVSEKLEISLVNAKAAINFKPHKTVHFDFWAMDEKGEQKELDFMDVLHDETADSAEDLFIESEKSRGLRGLVEGLAGKEYHVIVEYYYKERTLKEIGDDLRLTESRITDLKRSAEAKLRGRVGSIMHLL